MSSSYHALIAQLQQRLNINVRDDVVSEVLNNPDYFYAEPDEAMLMALLSKIRGKLVTEDMPLLLLAYQEMVGEFDLKSPIFYKFWMLLSIQPSVCLILWQEGLYPETNNILALEHLNNAFLYYDINLTSELKAVKNDIQKQAILTLLSGATPLDLDIPF